VLLQASSINFSNQEKLFLQKNKTIKISNETDWYPYDYNENGIPKGFAVDYMKLLANKSGFRIVFVSDNWKNLLSKFSQNQIDIMLLAGKNTVREKKYLFSNKPILRMKYVLVTKQKDKNITSLSSLRDKKLALVRGWVSATFIKHKYKNIHFIEFDTSLDALEAVAFGIADATIEDESTAKALIDDNMLSNLYISKNNNFDLSHEPLFLMLKEKNKILLSILNKAMIDITPQELEDLKEKWLKNFQMQENEKIQFSPQEKKYLNKKRIINMCIDPNWMPLEKNENGKHIGMTKDYMQILEREIGIPIKMIPTKTWLESIKFAKQRKCDIYSLAMPTPERKLYMDFTKPYLEIPLVLVTRNDEIFYSDVTKIKNKEIGIVKGYAYGEILKVKYPSMNLIEVKNLQKGLKEVEQGKLFGLIGTLSTVGYNIQKNYIGQLKITGKFEEKWELGVGTRNDEPLLRDIFDKAISSISPQEHQEILNKWISVNYSKPNDYSLFIKILLGTFLVLIFILYRQYELKKYNKQLEKLSQTDVLTGIYNRLKLDEVLDYEIKSYQRYKKTFCIILLDIDNFKQINDTLGHSFGDKFLVQFSGLLKLNKRETDSLGRWGGEEFLFILPQTDLEGAHKFAQKLKEIVERYDFKHIGRKTASFGVAQIQENETLEVLFDRVDKALYFSKKNGKNRVTIDL
jgi:polar amino acid transport system substrate-binding protein